MNLPQKIAGKKHACSTRRRGLSLLELILSATLIAIALVPALTMIRRSLVVSREMEIRNLLTTYCVSTLEHQLAIASATWTTDPATVSGTFSADGYSSIRYLVERSDQLADGGKPDSLMSVTVTVWEDSTANSAIDSGELNVSFTSKIAKLTTYPQ